MKEQLLCYMRMVFILFLSILCRGIMAENVAQTLYFKSYT